MYYGFEVEASYVEIMTTKQASELWGVTPRRVSEMCRDGRIKGAYKIGTAWVMPANTAKPKDKRVTTGKWVGYKRKQLDLDGGIGDGKKRRTI